MIRLSTGSKTNRQNVQSMKSPQSIMSTSGKTSHIEEGKTVNIYRNPVSSRFSLTMLARSQFVWPPTLLMKYWEPQGASCVHARIGSRRARRMFRLGFLQGKIHRYDCGSGFCRAQGDDKGTVITPGNGMGKPAGICCNPGVNISSRLCSDTRSVSGNPANVWKEELAFESTNDCIRNQLFVICVWFLAATFLESL